MRQIATPRLRAALWLTAMGITAAIGTARPEPVAVAAPFALLVLVGLRRRGVPELEAELRLDQSRVREGDRVPVELEIRSESVGDRVDVRFAVPRGLALDAPDLRAIGTAKAESRTVELGLEAHRWGSYTVGRVQLRRYDRLRLIADERDFDFHAPLRVYPPMQTLRSLVRPLETQAAVGDHVARERADGIELAELRPFVEGDEPRRVNWRATARTGDLVVNELHPERSTDVVIFVDASADEGSGGATPLDQSIRAAAALAERYLTRRDRVGLMVSGGALRWLRPARGAAHLHRIFDMLIETRALAAPAGGGRSVRVPARAIPAHGLVLAVSPLIDSAVVGALLDLRGRGYDLAVLEISPLPYLDARDSRAQLAMRLLRLERELLRTQLRARGVAVVEWDEPAPLDGTVRALEEYRRRARVVHA